MSSPGSGASGGSGGQSSAPTSNWGTDRQRESRLSDWLPTDSSHDAGHDSGDGGGDSGGGE
jgi:hypothetical protein